MDFVPDFVRDNPATPRGDALSYPILEKTPLFRQSPVRSSDLMHVCLRKRRTGSLASDGEDSSIVADKTDLGFGSWNFRRHSFVAH